ncbi:MAG TPA: DUF3630 family protein [Chitinophagaceae bacterium]|nr:DUF3630 family protein [Chitinophagaceae bacterium]
MSLTLRTDLGCTEAVLLDDGNLHHFYQVASILSDDMRLSFVSKQDEFDAISWDFKYKGHPLTLQYSIYNGITVFPTRTRQAANKENKAVEELAGLLLGKMSGLSPQKNIA